MFWDGSALIPYLAPEAESGVVASLLKGDRTLVIWWVSPVECVSALERRRREEKIEKAQYDEARRRLEALCRAAFVVQPHPQVRSRAERLLALHSLRAGDALQLAAALVASDERPQAETFVSLDGRLRDAAHREGFKVIPEE